MAHFPGSEPWWLREEGTYQQNPDGRLQDLFIRLTPLAQVDGQALRGKQGIGVVFAQHTAAAVQGVLVQVPGRLHLTELAKVR